MKRYPVIKEKLESCSMILVENIPESGETGVDPDILYYSGDSTIEQVLSEKNYRAIVDYINKKTNNDKTILTNLTKMRPQLLGLALSYLDTDTIYTEAAGDLSMDQFLVESAKQKGLAAKGLENAKERSTAVLNTESDKKAIKSLLAKISRTDKRKEQATKGKEKSNDSKERYLDLKINYYFDKTPPDNGGVTERNALWLKKLPTFMEHQGCFVAVGLDHLRFKLGLIRQLQTIGYTVKPVQM